MLLSFADMFILKLRVAICYTQHPTDLAHTSTLCDSALYCRLQVLAFLFVRHDKHHTKGRKHVSHRPTF